MKLAGLADGSVSGEVTWGSERGSPALAVRLAMVPGTRKFTSQGTPTSGKLCLQVNVIFPPSSTTYPPGAGTVSVDRVTANGMSELLINNVLNS